MAPDFLFNPALNDLAELSIALQTILVDPNLETRRIQHQPSEKDEQNFISLENSINSRQSIPCNIHI